jgi:hypothetical protein
MGYRIDFRVGGGVLEASGEHVLHCIFAERAARRLGCHLRRFEDHRTVLAWLRSAAA